MFFSSSKDRFVVLHHSCPRSSAVFFMSAYNLDLQFVFRARSFAICVVCHHVKTVISSKSLVICFVCQHLKTIITSFHHAHDDVNIALWWVSILTAFGSVRSSGIILVSATSDAVSLSVNIRVSRYFFLSLMFAVSCHRVCVSMFASPQHFLLVCQCVCVCLCVCLYVYMCVKCCVCVYVCVCVCGHILAIF